MGDFAHTLLILLAVQKLTPEIGAIVAASLATGLYVLHNVLYAGFSATAGWLADLMPKGHVLAFGYSLAALMAAAIIVLPLNPWTLSLVFGVGGIYIAIEETVEGFILRRAGFRTRTTGMAFGTLATVNGIGDFASSIIVGLLWTSFGTSIAFGYERSCCSLPAPRQYFACRRCNRPALGSDASDLNGSVNLLAPLKSNCVKHLSRISLARFGFSRAWRAEGDDHRVPRITNAYHATLTRFR